MPPDPAAAVGCEGGRGGRPNPATVECGGGVRGGRRWAKAAPRSRHGERCCRESGESGRRCRGLLVPAPLHGGAVRGEVGAI